MKKCIWSSLGFIVVLFLTPPYLIASGHLARGAVPGELYLHGAGGNYLESVCWLYRSTDYGQTASCQSMEAMEQIAEGVIEGELYKTAQDHIYYSSNFGETFLQKGYIANPFAIAGGYTLGEVYAYRQYGNMKYSIDYGETFVDKGVCPGQVWCLSVGHDPGEIYCGCTAGEIYFSDDYGETYERVIDLDNSGTILSITRGNEVGEIYFLGADNKLYYSPNKGDSLYQQYYFDIDPEYLWGTAGGYLPGEIYVLESRLYFTGGGDLYLHRSTDYGKTFVVSHVHSGIEDMIPPESIDDLNCTLCYRSLFLDWSPISKDIGHQTEQVDYYIVYRHQSPHDPFSASDSIGFSITPCYFDPMGRRLSQNYYYVVKAVDDSGNKSGDSNRVGKFSNTLINE